MKKTVTIVLAAVLAAGAVHARDLIILHTNDTHSQIDPVEADGLGGVQRRKALVDSVRTAARANGDEVLLIDLGDAVQGTLYFNLYRGEVENKLINALGYDMRILGNHEFDNGTESLARHWRDTRATALSTNYDFGQGPLAPLFKPYEIRTAGGRKIGFIAINLRPKGMISEGNYDTVEYLDAVTAANATAWHLKHNEKVDMVIALTHIGYAPSGSGTSDTELARASQDIDLIIGGHSHTLIDPSNPGKSVPWTLGDSKGVDRIPVAQSGKSGRHVGQVNINLDDMTVNTRVLPVDSRYDNRLDPAIAAIIEPYRAGVDSLMNHRVARSAMVLDKESPELTNWVADFVRDFGRDMVGEVDFAIANKGGIRRGLPKGAVTEGQIESMLPFNNHLTVIELTGADILEALAVMTRTAGNGLSSEVDVTYYQPNNDIVSATVNGRPIDPARTYRVATVDYLANGGDYMEPLTRGKVLALSPNKLYEDVLHYLTKGPYRKKTIKPESRVRMRPVTGDNQK